MLGDLASTQALVDHGADLKLKFGSAVHPDEPVQSILDYAITFSSDINSTHVMHGTVPATPQEAIADRQAIIAHLKSHGAVALRAAKS